MNDFYKELEKEIINKESKSLSGEEVLNMCGNKANIFVYPDLVKYDNIDDILGEHNACIILYMTSKSYGHYTCIFKEGNEVQHFDSYGLKPDQELSFIENNFRKDNNQWKPHLTYLLYNSPYKITYNEYKLQKKGSNISTCGRWVAIRLILRKLSLKKFVDLFKQFGKYDSDFIVTFFTELI